MSINEFHKSVEAVFGPCSIWAKQGDKVISKGWTPLEGTLVKPELTTKAEREKNGLYD